MPKINIFRFHYQSCKSEMFYFLATLVKQPKMLKTL